LLINIINAKLLHAFLNPLSIGLL